MRMTLTDSQIKLHDKLKILVLNIHPRRRWGWSSAHVMHRSFLVSTSVALCSRTCRCYLINSLNRGANGCWSRQLFCSAGACFDFPLPTSSYHSKIGAMAKLHGNASSLPPIVLYFSSLPTFCGLRVGWGPVGSLVLRWVAFCPTSAPSYSTLVSMSSKVICCCCLLLLVLDACDARARTSFI